MNKVKIKGFKCIRCGHEWVPRKNTRNNPVVCPKCKSPYWDIPKKPKKRNTLYLNIKNKLS